MRTSDLDNFIVPVAKALCYVVFGTFQRPQRLVEVHALKAISNSPAEVGVQVAAWSVLRDETPLE